MVKKKLKDLAEMIFLKFFKKLIPVSSFHWNNKVMLITKFVEKMKYNQQRGPITMRDMSSYSGSWR